MIRSGEERNFIEMTSRDLSCCLGRAFVDSPSHTTLLSRKRSTEPSNRPLMLEPLSSSQGKRFFGEGTWVTLRIWTAFFGRSPGILIWRLTDRRPIEWLGSTR